ncbi:amino acid adenylation domain-containing protein [Leptolyngbyaceae cyanobacterium CCMR0082]|uniref:Phenyloxazoline synthase MbtB n=1 Tax=Adonisia turfae CCMR0082 TaxID=2304604 RepID=A0A6M0S0S0_9CYAN|nr:non-ribosomal peptide synthetase [Adonisia turfae]NEZ61542.1 amino acid adenylation domain-containing protein [Adonisia turfae CCMR0082]
MDLQQMLLELSELGVKLWIDKNNKSQLHIRAPQGVLTPELKKRIGQQKSEILDLLGNATLDTVTHALPSVNPAPQDRHQPFPLTDLQHAFWIGRSGLLELGGVSNHGYYEIDGDNLDIVRLNQALNQVIRRHDMLRAVVMSDGQQKILEDVPAYQIKVIDLRSQPMDQVDAHVKTTRDQLSHQVLPADQWPLFDFRATLLPEQRVRLHVSYDLLIFDAWSLFLLFDEWFKLYENPELALPALELSYRDFVLGEQKILQTNLYERSRHYWLSRLDNFPGPPDLPLTQNPKDLKQYRCQRYESRLESQDWQQLQKLAKQAGLTATGILLASFAEVLGRWSKKLQFVINVASFNRLPLHSQISEILGNFTSVTLLAVDNAQGKSFRERAQSIQQQLWQDLEHSYFNGVRVTRELNQREHTTPKAMPIVFTSTLGMEALGQKMATFNHFGQLVYGSAQASQAWMDVQVWDEQGTLTFNWDVVEELFPVNLVGDMFEAYCALLERLATDTTVWDKASLQILPQPQLAQRDKLNSRAIGDASIAKASITTSEWLHTLFIKQVRQQAQHCAVIDQTCTLTYQQLYSLANEVGHCLREIGVRPNQLVAVAMEKGWEQIVAVLGILMAGAAYVPIDPGWPDQRRAYLLDNSGAQIVLTQSWLNEKISWPTGVHIINLNRLNREDCYGQSLPPLEPVQTIDDLAYLIYTSGSTGTPKGVKISHRGAVNTILDINRRFSVGTCDRILALSSLSFDLSVYDIFGTLAAGGTIILPQASQLKEPDHWIDLISQHQITLWNSVPALMQMLVDATSNHTAILSSLRLVLLSGDWIPLTLPPHIQTLVSDVQVISLGGATEASIWSLFYPIHTVEPTWKSIPYGRPLTNQSFHVLNQRLEPCPTWVPGDLYIGGVGLAQGYWQDESKTNASFITHPDSGERLYRTGDLGRYLPDGDIEFLGREDFQVKLGGYRIELGEIEAVLGQYRAVNRALVSVVGKHLNEKRLVAHIVPHGSITVDELKQFVRAHLPDYMIPSVFVIVEALPLSANGKIDRQALSLPNDMVSGLTVDYIAPQNELEKTICEIWKDTLNIDKVGVDHNFFEVGGNSLLITTVFNRLKERLVNEVELISLSDLFKYPTIHRLADYLSAHHRPASISPTSKPLDKQQVAVSLSEGKQRLKQQLQRAKAIKVRTNKVRKNR